MEPSCRRIMYPIIPEAAIVRSIEALKRSTIADNDRPTVRAATLLRRDSSTQVIDVNRLPHRNTPIIQYIEVAETEGRLYCLDGLVNSTCWVKVVPLAEDCQSCNVILMSTDGGVILKAIRSITPGEPLLMWFTENILAMMNMPFLTPANIRSKRPGRVLGMIAPNGPTIHLALQCDRLDINHLWNVLTRELTAPPRTTLPLDIFPHNVQPFHFELTSSPHTSPTRISPIIVETRMESTATLTEISPGSLIQVSPSSSIHPSPSSSIQISPVSSAHPSPVSSTHPSPGPSTQTSPTTVIQSSPGLSAECSPVSATQSSPCLSKQPSPGPSTQSPPRSLVQLSPKSSNQVCRIRKNLGHRHSAFKPYMNQPHVYPVPVVAHEEPVVPHCTSYHVTPSHAQVRPELHAAQMETIVSNLGKSKRGHLCIYCGKVYSRKYGLKIHIRTHTGYKPLKCKYCLRPFGDPSNLNKHVRLHADGDTPYRCELCGKVLVRRRDLERHIKSRHQDNADLASDTSSDGTDV
ncbi:zinc finger protein 362 isoform X2 [Cephus cinctus]|uniref:Zinc finger protein 362 isoform X2 n=1 Tax=Cephus cinctus TaxID=211228 RepID=A0AAJ7RE32_CEPCN|nr:zinc finger protein 362 isoform X2 [Cephus cinctus]